MTPRANKHNMPRLTRQQIQESGRLRLLASQANWSCAEIAKVCGCHPDTIKQWLGERCALSVERQAMLRAHWSIAPVSA